VVKKTNLSSDHRGISDEKGGKWLLLRIQSKLPMMGGFLCQKRCYMEKQQPSTVAAEKTILKLPKPCHSKANFAT